jgi:hypothetical protein
MANKKQEVSTGELREQLVNIYRSMSPEQQLKMSIAIDRELLLSQELGGDAQQLDD